MRKQIASYTLEIELIDWLKKEAKSKGQSASNLLNTILHNIKNK